MSQPATKPHSVNAAPDTVLRRLGLTRLINAAGTLSRLGGANVDPDVARVMADAASLSVDVWALQGAASERIAAVTGAEAGIVTTGASAGLTLAAAAVLGGLDAGRISRLPDAGGLPNEILIPRTHRNGYDRALTLAGARLVDIGVDDVGTGAGVRPLETWEVETAITPRTVAIAGSGAARVEPDLPILADVARRTRLPLIVDAAAQLPPRENLSRYIAMGASLVVFSGGKAIRGPQGSGLLIGRRPLIASAALQMLDMDVRPAAFRAPAAFFPDGAPPTLPRHGIGRGFKASKEAIVGLLVALERFMAADPMTTVRAVQTRLNAISAALAGIPGLGVRREPAQHAERLPRLVLAIDPEKAQIDAAGVVDRLAELRPAVMLGEGRIAENLLILDLACVAVADDEALALSIRAALKA
jgi:L-seryl-tRNA(Ser) seleniumtransferase